VKEAAKAFRRSVALRKDWGGTWMDLGEACLKEASLAEAEKAFKKAAGLGAGGAEAHRRLGDLFGEEGRGQLARENYAACLGLEAGNDKCKRGLFVVMEMGEPPAETLGGGGEEEVAEVEIEVK
jgi:Flp pilus assembly protein TadD